MARATFDLFSSTASWFAANVANRNVRVWLQLLLLLVVDGAVSCVAAAQDADQSVQQLVDQYFDQRYEDEAPAASELLQRLSAEHDIKTPLQLEALLRDRRADYPPVSEWIGKSTQIEVACDHVSYESSFLMYVPEGYEADRTNALVIVGHGGNSSMSEARATSVAKMYLDAYAPIVSRELDAIVVAPVSERGWGHIGNSLILSTISKVKRMLPVDPDRIYVTGQSMGGHLSYRSALTLADRWGAVSPQSGGYDYVEKGSIGNLLNVPGYVTWGKREPYGIDQDNRTNAEWAKQHGLDWVFVEKDGGHAIYQDELPNMAQFFAERPRDLYRDTVYLRQGGTMKFVKTWNIQGWPEHEIYHETRPLRWNMRHWLEVTPRPYHDSPLTLLAQNQGNNRIVVTSDQARSIRVYLHPEMVDFDEPVTVIVNGEKLYERLVQPDLEMMLALAREFDDRGRVFWAALDFEVGSDREVEFPISP